MTAQEFNTRFDVLYNNITSNQAPGLDTYEKSVFLTKAQDEIIKNYFLRQSNPKQAGFDNNQKRQADFSNIIKTDSISSFNNIDKYVTQDSARKITLPSDLFLIINELVKSSNRWLVVKSISFDEYDRLMQKPFKYPTYNQAWRLIVGTNIAEIVVGPNETITEYRIRYIRIPKPIIVGDLSGETINGYYFTGTQAPVGAVGNTSGCELDESLHEEILQRAVELAKVAWANPNDNTQMLIQTGSRSE